MEKVMRRNEMGGLKKNGTKGEVNGKVRRVKEEEGGKNGGREREVWMLREGCFWQQAVSITGKIN